MTDSPRLTAEQNVQALGLVICRMHPQLAGRIEIHYSNQFPLLWRARRGKDGQVKIETSMKVSDPDIRRPLRDLANGAFDLWAMRTTAHMLMERKPGREDPHPLPRKRQPGGRRRKAEVDWLGMEKDLRKLVRESEFYISSEDVDEILTRYTGRGPELT